MNKEEFQKELNNLNIKNTEETLNKFETYKDLLKEYNKKFNLTSIINDNEIYLKHFLDSLYILKTNKIEENKTLLDIGSGAGFPGIPLQIILPNIKVTLIEANTKKCGFLKLIKEKLNLKNLNIINERAEIYTKQNTELYDIVTSRAVSHLKVLTEISLPALKINGYFLPLKGELEEELKKSEEIITTLGGNLTKIINYKLPIESSKRTIPIITKIKETPKEYPREYNKIIKDLKKNKK